MKTVKMVIEVSEAKYNEFVERTAHIRDDLYGE